MNEQIKITSTPAASLKLALHLAETYGFSVIPCGKAKSGKLKRPLVKAWNQNGSADPVAIRKMWAGQYGPLAVGIVCGLSDIWVLDADKEHVETEEDKETGEKIPTGRVFYGLDELDALQKEYGQLPRTFTVRTGSGGLHYYFKQPKGCSVGSNSIGRLREYAGAIDVRGTNGQVIAPGNIYMWNGQIVRYDIIDDSPIADAPAWLVDMILDRAPVQALYPEEPAQAEVPKRAWEQTAPAPAPAQPAQTAQTSDQEWQCTEDENGNLIFHCPDMANLEAWVDYSDPVARDIRREVTRKAKDYINNHPEVILTPDKSGKGYICPICGSGSGRNGTGMTLVPRKRNGEPFETPHFRCWNGKCEGDIRSSSVLDLIGKINGIPADREHYKNLIKTACRIYGIRIDDEVSKRLDKIYMEQTEGPQAQTQTQATASAPAQSQPLQAGTDRGTAAKHKVTKAEPKPEMDFTEYYKQCAARLHETDCTRGLNALTLNTYNVGYDPEWRNPLYPQAPASPRLIIPKSKNCYFARDTRPLDQIPPAQRGNTKMTVNTGTETQFFNFGDLDRSFPVFITEGEIDALSLLQLGIPAVALGGTSYASNFLTAVDKRMAEGFSIPPLVLAMDSDDAGQGAQEVLRIGLQGRSLPFSELTIPEGSKDPNEALNKDEDAFFIACNEAITRAQGEAAAMQERLKEELRNQCAGRALDAFLDETRKTPAPYYPTGVRELDYLLDGGLYAGLYIMGAISSLGKTTFALSIADYIASHGQDVLIFSLEMARNELIAKSVSRITARICRAGWYSPSKGEQQAPSTAHAQTTRSVLGKRSSLYVEQEKEVLDMAFDEYRQIGEHLYISEGIGNIGVQEVRTQVQNHTRIMGKPPVVIIDYLQILAPADPRSTDKQNTDKAVLELKRISRDFSTPVFAISSFNRDNYAQSVSMVAFKESGAIEYSSDVLLGMQYNGMDAPDVMLRKLGLDTAKTQPENVKYLTEYWQERSCVSDNDVELQIKVLKNRNGRRGRSFVQKYWPWFNYFEDLPESEADRRRKEKEDYHRQRAKEQANRRKRKKEDAEAAEVRRKEDAEKIAQMEALPPEQQPFEPLETDSRPSLPGTEEVPY